MNVIINADDLGKSIEVNEAIFDMMARGSVTSATILANGPKLQNALTRLAHFPHCSFGVHLNADEFFRSLRQDRSRAFSMSQGCLFLNGSDK